jgi:hypothetical protein
MGWYHGGSCSGISFIEGMVSLTMLGGFSSRFYFVY